MQPYGVYLFGDKFEAQGWIGVARVELGGQIDIWQVDNSDGGLWLEHDWLPGGETWFSPEDIPANRLALLDPNNPSPTDR